MATVAKIDLEKHIYTWGNQIKKNAQQTRVGEEKKQKNIAETRKAINNLKIRRVTCFDYTAYRYR